MKTYILTGDPAEVEKVIRENRIRISRGVISITPVDTESQGGTIPEHVVETPGNESHESADDKNALSDDFKEVNLDADTKETEVTDTKEAPMEDMKESVPKKTSSRKK